MYSYNGVSRSFLKYEVFFTKCCIWPLRFFTIMHLFLYFYSSLLWCWNDCSLIAASAELMVCALPPCSTQNVNHIRNHRAFGDLNTLFLPRSWKSLPAIKDFLRTILHGTRYYFGAHSNFFWILFENRAQFKSLTLFN